MKSLISYKSRGHWGKSNWRGNCSGYVIKDLIEQFKPKYLVDVCEGSGTSGEVCRDFNIDYTGLDLHSGFDFTFDFVLSKLKRPADIVFSHPPYHDMINYSNNDKDTSKCKSVDEFLEKSQMMLLNQREATAESKYYCTLIGDQRRAGEYRSFQADYINMMPKCELYSIVIKAQHNCFSDRVKYKGDFIPILHEYLIIWKKKQVSLWNICFEVAGNINKKIASTWRNAIRIVMSKFGSAKLKDIYSEVEKVASHLIENNKNWKAKIRQILQKYYINVSKGEWGV